MFSYLSLSVLRQTSVGLKLFDDVFYSQAAVCKEDFFSRDLRDESDTRKTRTKRQNVTH